MTRLRLSSIVLAGMALTSCAAPGPEARDADGSEARYVEAASLLGRDDHRDLDVLTSVELRRLSAEEVETLLQSELPENVRVGRTGRSDALLLQGPGEEVVAAIRMVQRLDAL